MFNIGDAAPNFTLSALDGTPVVLSDVLGGGHSAVLIFLRHLG